MISMGLFGDAKIFEPLVSTLTEGRDRYLLSYDFNDYLRAQKDVDEAWKNKKQWARMSIMSTAGIASFSSDRTIQRYAKEIWSINVSLDILLLFSLLLCVRFIPFLCSSSPSLGRELICFFAFKSQQPCRVGQN